MAIGLTPGTLLVTSHHRSGRCCREATDAEERERGWIRLGMWLDADAEIRRFRLGQGRLHVSAELAGVLERIDALGRLLD
ncbi:hypothetical protein [Streptomyces longisporoflavus]|uniref:Transposase n=1 Tax=Streptomyces longisporoflavus TaxID=28044 RepID=A0ABW7QHW0_9ACTN